MFSVLGIEVYFYSTNIKNNIKIIVEEIYAQILN